MFGEEKRIFYCINKYINLVTFSGFLFCYGYNVYSVYLQKEFKEVRLKLIRNVFKMVIIFWISGIVYNFLIERDINTSNYIKIFYFLKLPPYSEFLASFAILNLIILIFFKIIKKILKNDTGIKILIILSLIFTVLPYKNIQFCWSELFINTQRISFPIIPYLSIFLIGVCFSKHKPKFSAKISVMLGISFFIFIIVEKYFSKEIIIRFPPNLIYILLSFIPLYFYYYITKRISDKFEKNKIFNEIILIGRYTLYYFIISNLIIFIKKWMIDFGLISLHQYSLLLIYLEIVVIPYIYIKIYIFMKEKLLYMKG